MFMCAMVKLLTRGFLCRGSMGSSLKGYGAVYELPSIIVSGKPTGLGCYTRT